MVLVIYETSERMTDGVAQTRHGSACPGHLSPQGAGSGGPDEPSHDDEEKLLQAATQRPERLPGISLASSIMRQLEQHFCKK